VNHNFPVRLHEAIGRLMASGRSNDVGSIVNKVVPNRRPKKFSVAIAPKTPSIRSHVSPKETKSTENRRTRQILETKHPVIMSGTLDEDERVSEATCGYTIPKGNVNMNNVKVERLFTIDGRSPRSFWNRREGTERDWELAAINPLTIKTGLKDMLVIAETTAAEGTMKSSEF